MEESFEEVMALNSVLKDGGKFIMLKEKSFNEERESTTQTWHETPCI